MIDLDASILRAESNVANGWNEGRAVEVATELVDHLELQVDYEPPDEEWIRFGSTLAGGGMLSVRIPLAIVWPTDAPLVDHLHQDVVTVAINDLVAEELRASASLLKATVLPYGWGLDFDTEAFSANDLFVESV